MKFRFVYKLSYGIWNCVLWFSKFKQILFKPNGFMWLFQPQIF